MARNKPKEILERLGEKPILTAFIVFIIIWFLVSGASIKRGKSYKGEFLDSVLVEAHGLLFDIFIFGILIVFFNRIGERRRNIARWQEEIDDFRGWDEKEATFRIVGNIKRLNRNGEIKIDLSYCYLKGALLGLINLQGSLFLYSDLSDSSLVGTNLQNVHCHGTNFNGASLEDANLKGAHLKWTDLRGVEDLTIEQLSKVKTLYQAKFDQKLEKQIKEKYPHLFEKPGWLKKVMERMKVSRAGPVGPLDLKDAERIDASIERRLEIRKNLRKEEKNESFKV